MLAKFIDKAFFKDRPLTVLSGSALVFAILGVVRVLLSVQQYDYNIPVGYSQYGLDTIRLGDWFTLYDFAFFIAVTSLISVVLALRLFKLNRQLAISVLIMQHIIIIFFFLVSNAILGQSPVAS